MTSRREFLGGMAAAAGTSLLAGCATHQPIKAAGPAALITTGPGSLKVHAAQRGFLYGCAVSTGKLGQDEAYEALIREQANIVVAENAMKWAMLRPTIDTYNFDQADALLAF